MECPALYGVSVSGMLIFYSERCPEEDLTGHLAVVGQSSLLGATALAPGQTLVTGLPSRRPRGFPPTQPVKLCPRRIS